MCGDFCRRRVERHPCDGNLYDCGFARGIRHSRGVARHCDGGVVHWRAADGKKERDYQAAARRRNPWQCIGHLL